MPGMLGSKATGNIFWSHRPTGTEVPVQNSGGGGLSIVPGRTCCYPARNLPIEIGWDQGRQKQPTFNERNANRKGTRTVHSFTQLQAFTNVIEHNIQNSSYIDEE